MAPGRSPASIRTGSGFASTLAFVILTRRAASAWYGSRTGLVQPAIAPHLAAEEAGRPVDFEAIAASYATLTALSDVVIVEGAGGWRTPLGGALTVGHLARHLDLPVIIVVGLRLGCLNHAMLTAESILADGAAIAGWVANELEPGLARRAANVATLCDLIPAPCLGLIPCLEPPDVAAAAACLDLQPLLG
jgi:dethiobiotin synthetase